MTAVTARLSFPPNMLKSLSDVRPVREKGERELGAEGAEKFSGHFDKGFADFL